MEIALVTAAFLGMLTLLCAHVRVGSRAHRALSRAVCAVCLLMLSSLLPGMRVGVNALTVACVACLGLPGLGLLQVLTLMP